MKSKQLLPELDSLRDLLESAIKHDSTCSISPFQAKLLLLDIDKINLFLIEYFKKE